MGNLGYTTKPFHPYGVEQLEMKSMDFTEKGISQGSSHVPSKTLGTLSKRAAHDYILEKSGISRVLTADQSIFLPRAHGFSKPRGIFINSALPTLPEATEALG